MSETKKIEELVEINKKLQSEIEELVDTNKKLHSENQEFIDCSRFGKLSQWTQ